jgi:hypothetical protein
MSKRNKETDPIRKLWQIFKAGKNEIFFIISLYNMFQLWRVTENDMNNFYKLLFGLVILGLLIGYVEIKKLRPSQTFLNPYTQDNIRAGLLQTEGFIETIKGNKELAIEKFIESINIRKRWLDKDNV